VAATLDALRDPSFQPVYASELPQLDYEISVLSPLYRYLRKVFASKHARAASSAGARLIATASHAVLQKPKTEIRWVFNEEICSEACMSPDRWKDGSIDIFIFTAVVFGEQLSKKLPGIVQFADWRWFRHQKLTQVNRDAFGNLILRDGECSVFWLKIAVSSS
jgi:AMMECR1 domain-containing protein